MKGLGYGRGYRYAHDFEDGVVAQQNLPDNLRGATYYAPTDRGFELNWETGCGAFARSMHDLPLPAMRTGQHEPRRWTSPGRVADAAIIPNTMPFAEGSASIRLGDTHVLARDDRRARSLLDARSGQGVGHGGIFDAPPLHQGADAAGSGER